MCKRERDKGDWLKRNVLSSRRLFKLFGCLSDSARQRGPLAGGFILLFLGITFRCWSGEVRCYIYPGCWHSFKTVQPLGSIDLCAVPCVMCHVSCVRSVHVELTSSITCDIGSITIIVVITSIATHTNIHSIHTNIHT